MRIDLQDDEGVEVQMAPLIDCVFLLIIFFLVSTVMKKLEKELPVDLPRPATRLSREVKKEAEMLIISIDSQGRFHLGANPVSLELLRAKLRETAAVNPLKRVRIDGDRRAPFESAVHILELCQLEGLKNVGIHTAREKPPGK
jgi:biopolymer transport protein ExbD